jgi:hypothetical protein
LAEAAESKTHLVQEEVPFLQFFIQSHILVNIFLRLWQFGEAVSIDCPLASLGFNLPTELGDSISELEGDIVVTWEHKT